MHNMKISVFPEPILLEHLLAHYRLKGQLERLAGEIDHNYRFRTDAGEQYVLKVSGPDQDIDLLEMQQAALHFLTAQPGQVQLPRPVGNISTLTDEHGHPRYIRLYTWLEGRLWADVMPHSEPLLYSLGQACGEVCQRLSGFDHPAAHRSFKWNLSEASWIEDCQDRIAQPADRELIAYFIDLYHQEAKPRLARLRRGVHYNDANDYNILTAANGAPLVTGLIDFGDAVFSELINEPAIAIAYAAMDKPDFLGAAAAVVRGFHTQFPLEEEELAALFPLVAMRLCVSVTNSAYNRIAQPDNTYLQVSDQPAWEMLRRMRQISPALACYAFRHAAGLEPCPQRAAFDAWLADGHSGGPLLPNLGHAVPLDLSVSSLDLGSHANFATNDAFQHKINALLARGQAQLGTGGYAETRPFYTSDAYLVAGNNGPRWRSVHLGLDLWTAAGTPIYAPLPGVVHSLQDNAHDNDYGPTIILRHDVSDQLHFYTLYGHLTRTDLPPLKVGQHIAQGDTLAHIGPAPENGNWPPHLHFQVMLDMLDKVGDFPGVAFPDELPWWLSLCPNPSALLGGRYAPEDTPAKPSTQALLDHRRQRLGPNLSISYQQPLHIVRGAGPYLYDRHARRYLDTLNNVAHVGHQHPKVVEAISRQAAVLNTNTRYLHDNILQLADALCATLPPELCVCYFVNSGSEATELALRLAYTWSGQRDILALEAAYHGNTAGCVGISHYKFDGPGGQGAPPHTQVLPMPDVYRGAHRGADAGLLYAAYATQAIGRLQTQGRGPAAFIAESVLSCGGQIPLPPGYLPAVYGAVRAAGGLCIADEVQVGFGRAGHTFWAFQDQGVVPDIVTMGKPMGNGHPIGAVVTTRAVADAFANGMEYFNTFGGNPVSCAAGLAVLQIIAEEGLQQQAAASGDYLSQGLRELAGRFPLIGDVRGPGLFLGFELVRDPLSLSPAAEEASYLANRLRELGVLISTDGPLHNVIKIKPPLCFGKTQSDFLLNSLERGLRELNNKRF
jgi:4-aminobutyrate aminotransferase-like enzyme/Ser/Thr protein kinase RdoA (MazF antagonist)